MPAPQPEDLTPEAIRAAAEAAGIDLIRHDYVQGGCGCPLVALVASRDPRVARAVRAATASRWPAAEDEFRDALPADLREARDASPTLASFLAEALGLREDDFDSFASGVDGGDPTDGEDERAVAYHAAGRAVAAALFPDDGGS